MSMARSLSNVLFKGIKGFQVAPSARVANGYINRNGTGYFSTLPNDPDTHEDFRPADNKTKDSGFSLIDIVEKDIKENQVMIYMKGVPEDPKCGFSLIGVLVLQQYNVPFSARNVWNNPELKNAVKAISHFPTFPQIFINGEFIGNSDKILDMYQNGELNEIYNSITANLGKSE